MAGFIKEYARDLSSEFSGYDMDSFRKDLFAGVTVAAVALPLALAFGVGSGADAASGLIASIGAAFIIGTLGGASFPISGPSGAMTAILIPLSIKYGLQGLFAAGFIAGVIIFAAGLLRAGKLVYLLPAPVIAGFTSGIALIIALGQMEYLFGIEAHGVKPLERLYSLFANGFSPNYTDLVLGVFVIVLMLRWPRKWGEKIPGSLAGVIAGTALSFVLPGTIAIVGNIPRTIIHSSHLTINGLLSMSSDTILVPALSIAALGIIESLLCGAAGGRMKGEKLNGDRELLAQGIGNMILPFLGGIPVSAAIARSSVAIKTGGQTRLTGIIQGIVLLLSMFLLSPLISKIPLSILAGILIVTAWRMNEWHTIKYIFGKKFMYAAAKFLVTMFATVIFDLTIAIAAGAFLAIFLFAIHVANLEVTVSEIDPKRLDKEKQFKNHAQVIYITGSIFFGSIERFETGVSKADCDIFIFSMRGVPYIDTSGVQAFLDFCQAKLRDGHKIYFASVQPKVRGMLDKAGISELVGEDSFFNNAMDAIYKVDELTGKREA